MEDLDLIKENLHQYVSLKDQTELLLKRQNEIKTRLVESLSELGEEDSRGHKVLEINDSVTGINKLVHQKRVTKSLNMTAAEIVLKNKNIYKDCVKMVPIIDEDAVMSAYYQGHLTEEDIDAMFPAKITYAFLLNR
jgi:hypothetical protein